MKRFSFFCLLAIAVLVFVSCNPTPEATSNKEITITFDANGGAGVMSTVKTWSNTFVKLPANKFWKDGYSFTYWNTKPDGSGMTYVNEAPIQVEDNLKLYAQWSEIPVLTLVYNGNGATTGGMASQTVRQGVETKLPANSFTKKDYTFIGWGTYEGSGVIYQDQETVAFGVSTTLYAIWKHNTTTVSFDANGGTGTMASQVIDTKTETELKANAFSNEGMVFGYWNTTSDGWGAQYKDGETIVSEEPVRLYAQWAYPLTSDDAVLKGGRIYRVTTNVAIPERMTIEGTAPVTIILSEGTVLHAMEGISVLTGQKLTLDADGAGTGVLIAHSNSTKAAIGGSAGKDGNGGTIEIKNGLVTATLGQGSNGAAAIGAGQGGYKATVTISGGTVIADASCEGTGHGAGIGGGWYNGGTKDGIKITISGGTVVARSGEDGAGIGLGADGTGCSIVISGGGINAEGGSLEGAGIGGKRGKVAEGVSISVDHSVHLRYSDDKISWGDFVNITGKYMQTD